MSDRSTSDSDNDDTIDGSCWTYMKCNRKNDLDQEEEERIQKRQRRVCLRGYGVSYDWISESTLWSSITGYHWENSDGLFQGVSSAEFMALADRFRVSG